MISKPCCHPVRIVPVAMLLLLTAAPHLFAATTLRSYYAHVAVEDEHGVIAPWSKGANGSPMSFGWEGPDVIQTTWNMSVASPAWRDHLVQQARLPRDTQKQMIMAIDSLVKA